MSKKKHSKKKNQKKKTSVPASRPIKVVEVTIPEEKPVQTVTAVPEKSSPFRPVLKVSLLVLSALLLIGAGILILRMLPFSRAYSLVVSTPSLSLRVGEKARISYHFRQASDIPLLLKLQENRKQELFFESSDPSVAAVDEEGFLTVNGPGAAEIYVHAADMCETVHVDAQEKCTSLSFPEEIYEMNAGETLTLQAQKAPQDGVLYEDIVYSVSDPYVLSVDARGGLRANHPGTATVRAEAEGLIAEALVQVALPMTWISFPRELSLSPVVLERGEALSVPVRFFPVTTTDSLEVTYTLSDPEAGSITPEGVFTAQKTGKYTLEAESNGLRDQIELEILASLKGITLNTREKTLLYRQTDQLSYTLIPEDTTDELNVQWLSDNPGVATVSASGLVTAVGPGTTTIRVRVNGFEEQCVYHVHVPVTGVTISAGKLTLRKGQNAQLGASVYPSFATEDHGISWRSDNPSIASVNASGFVQALNAGTTRIYAVHGAFSASCLVTVYVPVPRSEIASRIINFGKQYLGTRYVYGGESLTGGIDCSSFVQKCFATQGIGLPRNSMAQSSCGSALPMDPSAWLPGDLLFYSPNGYVSHVAIYIGNGQILQSSESMGGVCITSYDYNGFTPSRARRIF